jgi:hypothetical protein
MIGGSIVPGLGHGIGAAAGAIIGGINGAMNRQAGTAGSDFSMADATTAIKLAYQTWLGRDPAPGEVESHLQNTGSAGSEWVGEQAIAAILYAIENSPEAKAPKPVAVASGGGTDNSILDPGRDVKIDQATAPVGKGPADPNSSRNAPRIVTRNGQTFLTEHGNERPLQPGEIASAQAYVDDFWKKYPSGFQPGVGPQTNEGYGAAPATTGGTGGGTTAKPANYRGQLIGFDQGKLDDATHQTPKYVFARIAAQYDVKDPAQRQAMLAALKADPSGYFKNASLGGSKGDILNTGSTDPKFEGINQFDIIFAAGEGGKGWTWQPLGGTEPPKSDGPTPDPTKPPSGGPPYYGGPTPGTPYRPSGPNTTYNSSMLGSNLVNDLLGKSLTGEINFKGGPQSTYSQQMLDYLMRQLALGGALR